MLSRRGFVAAVAGLFLLDGRRWGAAEVPASITVYKSKTCGCCTKWVDHLNASGFDTTVHDEEKMDQLKDEFGVPQAVRSCHTALIAGYLIEGHVPASDIRRLLAERPKVAGLAVPGMPAGTPGMAEPGSKGGDYEVVAFQSDGSTRHFASH
jgi:hypothetical protein